MLTATFAIRYYLKTLLCLTCIYTYTFVYIVVEIPEKPNKQMEIFYDMERFTNEFDGLLKSLT